MFFFGWIRELDIEMSFLCVCVYTVQYEDAIMWFTFMAQIDRNKARIKKIELKLIFGNGTDKKVTSNKYYINSYRKIPSSWVRY